MISLCMIVKNEEKFLESSLNSIRDHVDEIVIADTGSQDNTINIAKKYADKLVHFDWCDDFSKARNFSISHATHDWILVVDGDEKVEKFSPINITSPYMTGRIVQVNPFLGQDGMETYSEEQITRFFNKKHYHYTGRIHEQVSPLSENVHNENVLLDIIVTNSGNTEAYRQKSKGEFYLKLLNKARKEEGEHPYLLYQIGQTYFVNKEYQKCIKYFVKAMDQGLELPEACAVSVVTSYAYAMLNLQKYQEALSIAKFYERLCHVSDYLFALGLCQMNNALFNEAIDSFLQATKQNKRYVAGCDSYKAFYNIGVIYEVSGNFDQASAYYKKCGDYSPARVGEKRVTIL